MKRLLPKSMAYLPNAVNYAHFSDGPQTLPPEYAAITRPIAIYVGAMDVWFDYRLMDEVAARLPNVSFVLIGPDDLAKQRLRARPNLHLLGRRAYDELPRYLHHADVGLIPFDMANHAELVRSIHPLKLYEYAACGLPVVAVEWEELTYLNSPAQLCRGTGDFILAIEQAISNRPAKTELQSYAAAHDWGERVERFCTARCSDGIGACPRYTIDGADVNVVVVSDFAHVNGGNAAVALSSAVGLAQQGHAVTLFAGAGPVDPRIQSSAVTVVCTDQQSIGDDPRRTRAMVQGIWNAKAARTMAQMLESMDLDRTVVHVHGWDKVLSSSVVRTAIRTGAKVVCTYHA